MIYPRNRISNLPCVFEPGDYLSIANHLAILGILGYGSSCENLSTVLWHPRGANDWSHERHWAGQAKRCLGRVEMLFFLFLLLMVYTYIYIYNHTHVYIYMYICYIHTYVYIFFLYIYTHYIVTQVNLQI